jgi:hypothetical protein
MAAKKSKSSGKAPASYKDLSARKDDILKTLANADTSVEKFDEVLKQLNQVNALIEKRNKLNKDTIYGAKEYEDVLKSIGGKLDDQSKAYGEIKKALDFADAQADAMAGTIAKIPKSQKELRDTAYDAAAAYKQGNGEIQNAFASLLENKDANIDIAKVVQKQIDKQKEYITELEKGGDAAKGILEVNTANLDVLEKTKEAYATAAKDMKNIQKLGDKIGHSAFGGIINQGLGITKSLGITKQGNLGDVTKGLVEKRGLMGAAGQTPKGGSMMGALGGIAKFAGPAALIGTALFGIFKFVDSGGISSLKSAAKMLSGNKLMGEGDIKDKAKSLEGTEEFRKINAKYNYIKPLEERQTREKEMFDYSKQNYVQMVEYENSLVKDELSYQLGLKKDAIAFGHQQAMQTMEAEAGRRKALFVTGMSQYKSSLIVSERALQAIGSSTDAVLDSIKDIGVKMGVALSEQIKMATSAAGMGKLYGSSGEDVLKMSKSFRLMDKSSAKVAFNNVAGLGAFAKMNDMSPAQLFKQMADASEEVMKYSNMTTSQYASQAVLLSNMNTSMKDMAVASGTMVLNYKDSIKSEMSLSAMLGKNVNLSEVRARLMSGDMAGGASALKSALGGVDIGSMNAFQKQELSKSTGMGIDQLMSLTQSGGGGVKGTLEQQAGLKTGADIAKGALDMDVSLAAQRLGMEQAQRKEMMKFEQRERLIMLQLEQAQKLKMLEVEAYFRVKFTKEMEQSHEKQMAAAKHLEEKGAGIMMGGGKNLTDQAFRGLEGSMGAQKGIELTSLMGQMVQSGKIGSGDMRMAEYYAAQFELAETYKNQPDILAQKLEETYTKIFAQEAAAQRQENEKERALQLKQNERLVNIAKAADDINRLKGGGDTFEAYAKKHKVSQEERIAAVKLLNQGNTLGRGLNKDAVAALNSAVPATSTKPVVKASGEVKKNTTTTTGNKTGTTVTKTTSAPAPAPPASKDIYTLTEKGFNNSVISGNMQISTLKALKNLSGNGYTELLRRADISNELLNELIIVTNNTATTPITLDGKRLNTAFTKVKARMYGLAKDRGMF